ncbi:VirB4 family type IV secretion system protein [Priestia megaterium]|uniref:VirB4 family type IV secretion system protein n=1 Tax=Priestia megaterium TaxID=1404 RepID=UPI0023DB4537|nr:type IV secretion system protein VirB4 [Priestia megaterium]MDF2052962.1 type IV secretion system protein VirB4 [Priestia megaterium]MDF2062210.1 type IV secretion system protein VirB4 [Priestia megaterium]
MITLTFRKKEKTPQEIKQKKGYNPYFVAQIQPQGGVSFKENLVRNGDGYSTCIHIYEYPTNVNDFWLEPIMNMPNAITTLDVVSDERKQVVEAINKNMSEQNARHVNAKENIDRMDAQEQYLDMKELYRQVTNGEVIKRIHLRIYIAEKTIPDLEKRLKEVIHHLETHNFRGSIFLNEQEYEWESLVTHFDIQKKYPNKRKGKEIPALALAGGFPFHFTHLDDPYGTYQGTTRTGGSVIFDLFHKDQQRKSYNAVLMGLMGAGKSTFLKKVTTDNAIKGYKIRGFDIVGEFESLVRELGGKQIALDGSEGQINPLQVFKTHEHEINSFTQHLSKLTVFYRFIAPEAKDDELKEYEKLLRKLYIQKQLWNDEKGASNHITGLSPEAYPTFSEFLQLIRQELYADEKTREHHPNLGEYRKRRLELIELNIENLVETYAHLFDGISTIEDFNDEQVVFFSIRHLSKLKDEIAQAQLFNVMSLLWDGMLQNGEPQLAAYTKGTLAFEDAIRYLIVIDEAHHIVNTKRGNEHALDFLTEFSREARKYFAGLIYASHLISDFVPDGSEQTAIEKIKKLFDLTQYKFIMQQDDNNLDTIQRVFKTGITDSELAEIPKLPIGDVLLCIKSVKNILFHIEIDEEEKVLYGGGA